MVGHLDFVTGFPPPPMSLSLILATTQNMKSEKNCRTFQRPIFPEFG